MQSIYSLLNWVLGGDFIDEVAESDLGWYTFSDFNVHKSITPWLVHLVYFNINNLMYLLFMIHKKPCLGLLAD